MMQALSIHDRAWRGLMSLLWVWSVVGFALLPLSAVADSRTFSLPGTREPVTIITDTNGTPHIRARTEFAAYVGIGYAMARDRLWQADLFRRAGAGRVSAILGRGEQDAILAQDILIRTLDFSTAAARQFAQAAPRTRRALRGFARGMNAYIEEAKAAGTLPPEFAILGYTPELWRPQDSYLVASGATFGFEVLVWLPKLQRAAITAMRGPAVANILVPVADETPSVVDTAGNLNPLSDFEVAGPIVSESVPVHPLPDPVKSAITRLPRHIFRWPFKLPMGSNNIAIDGHLTTTGKPLVETDVHLSVTVPSALYLMQVTTPRFSVQGFAIPGAPAFLSGHNRFIAWASTYGAVDGTDLYLELMRDGEEGTEVFVQGTWVPTATREEIFDIAGEAPITLIYEETPHGPLLNTAIPELDAVGPIALRSSQPLWKLDGFFAFPTSRTFRRFKRAARRQGIPFNWVFADNYGRHGHVGYVQSAVVPIRNPTNGLFPVPGFDGKHEWNGFVDEKALIAFYNPPSHVALSANNRIVPSDYAPQGAPVYISNAWLQPWRAQRIATRLLHVEDPIAPEELAAFALDTQSVVNPQMRDFLVNALDHAGLPAGDPHAAEALDALRAWDGNASKESQGAVIFETVLALLTRDMARPLLGPQAHEAYTTAVSWMHQIDALRRLFENPQAPFFGATSAEDAQDKLHEAVRRALGEADALLRHALGNDISTWTWGGLHTLTYAHPLAAVAPIFAIGTFPTEGDASTLNPGNLLLDPALLALPSDELEALGGLHTVFARDTWAAARAVWNLAPLHSSIGVNSVGQSGNPFSPFYADQAPLWRQGVFLSLP
jgi:penicillin amidase